MRNLANQICNFRGARNATSAAIASLAVLVSLAAGGCASSAASNYESRPFFQDEYGLGSHGRKTWFDHLVEVDPGGITTYVTPDYDSKAPQTIAILPFADRGSANYVVNKIPLTHRDQQERAAWAWTDANRMRRAITGYMASREFQQANMMQVDEILKEHGIDCAEKLAKVDPQTLGKWLGVDAVIYGEVTRYEAYYALLVSAYQVGANVKMVSTHDGKDLFRASGSRYDVNLMPAFDPIDIAINSGLTLLQLRDVTLARAEEEDAREIVLRIPRSEKLRNQLIEQAHDRQLDLEARASR
jgi:hypothetical protein